MSVTQDIIELRDLELEIKQLQQRMRILRAHKKKCEDRIMVYLDENNQPGVKFKEMTIIAKPKKKRKYISKTEKSQCAQDFLEKFGVYATTREIEDLFESIKGPCEQESKIQIYS